KLARRPNTSDDPCRNNRSCNLPSKPFFTIAPDDLPYFLFFRAVQPLLNGLSTRCVHAHVEGSIESKAESTILFIQLRRGHTQIREHAIYRIATAAGRPLQHITQFTQGCV